MFQVQQLFPFLPLSIIINDLRITRSVELTIENVLDGRLNASPIFREPDRPEELFPAVVPAIQDDQSLETIEMTSWDEISSDSGDGWVLFST